MSANNAILVGRRGAGSEWRGQWVIWQRWAYQNPYHAGARKLLISWTRGNQIVRLQNQVILERTTHS